MAELDEVDELVEVVELEGGERDCEGLESV